MLILECGVRRSGKEWKAANRNWKGACFGLTVESLVYI